MLGTIVNVRIDRPLNSLDSQTNMRYNANWGFIVDRNSGKITSAEACILGLKRPAERFQGKVIASVSGIHDDDIYIVAPVGKVMYAPEINAALGNIAGTSIRCIYEKSCGAVIFRDEGHERQFLLIKNLYGKHWGFSKGHMEYGENERQTATREVLEETGLHIRILNGFREVSGYHPRPQISKRVVFFLGKADPGDVVIQREEIERFLWVPYNEAMKLFRFGNDKRVLSQAWEWLMKHPDKA